MDDVMNHETVPCYILMVNSLKSICNVMATLFEENSVISKHHFRWLVKSSPQLITNCVCPQIRR